MCLSRLLGTFRRPSPSDIVPQESIDLSDGNYVIDTGQLNIPFTVPPMLVPIMMIPDTLSMSGVFDYGHNLMLIHPADPDNSQIMVDWLAEEYLHSHGMKANDCVFRVMLNPDDDPLDFWKPHKFYAVHRLAGVGQDSIGRYFRFKGVNNPVKDPHKVRDKEIIFLSIGVVY